jgi:hypothetical protein
LYIPRPTAAQSDETAEARALDLELRLLARREALGRVALGNVAEAFLRAETHGALGFARVSDYASERLGMSASQFHEHARVARELRRLPLVARAFEAGEIGWTKLRELVGAATPSTQRGWLRIAQTHNAEGVKLAARRMKEEARRSGITPDDGVLFRLAHDGVDAAPADTREPGHEEVDDGAAAEFRVRCPRPVRRLWHHVRVLARKVAGSDLADWQAAEAIAAEFFSLRGWPDGETNGMARSTHERHPARRDTGGERTFLESERPRSPLSPDALAEIRKPRSVSIDRYFPESPAPEHFARYLASAHERDARMRAILAALAQIDWEIGRRLRTCFERRLHLQLGYTNESAYVRDRLGMCIRKARALVALDRASATVSPRLVEAYRDGQVSWVLCLMLLRIVTAENAGAWIRRAGEVTVRRLNDEIEWALDLRDAGGNLGEIVPPPLGAPLGVPGSPSFARPRDAQRSTAELQIRGHEVDAPGTASDGADTLHADCEVYFRGPESVVALLHAAITSVTARGEPPWRGFERVLLYAKAYWEALPRHRDPIFERDGWRCAAPGCRSRRNLQDHHIIFRSLGGGNARWNRITLCAWHHIHGIHGGRARVRGHAGEALYWQLGSRRNGPPLMTTVGDTYVEAVGDVHEPCMRIAG